MEIEYDTHYNDEYWTGKKTYTDAQGRAKTYHGPALEWEGFDEVAKALSMVLPHGANILDIGCGGGCLGAYLLGQGFDVYGVDISQYAVDNCVAAMQGRVSLVDITTEPDLGTYDVVMSTDLMEHIYEEDLDRTFAWMKRTSNKFMFHLIATMPVGQEEFVHTKGRPVPDRWQETAVSGHVNVRNWAYWARYFTRQEMKIRWDLMLRFHAYRETIPWWREMMAWGHDCVWILEKT